MQRTFRSFLAVVFFTSFAAITYGEVWNGPPITFTKEPADCGEFDFCSPPELSPTLSENQDRITENVAITRSFTRGIFNIAQESRYSSESPADTEWTYGTTDDLDSLTFSSWVDWANKEPPGTVGRDAVLHLISEDIYIDIRLTSWGAGEVGTNGSFSYVRSTKPVPEPVSYTHLTLPTICSV